jgi:hypothetical protein
MKYNLYFILAIMLFIIGCEKEPQSLVRLDCGTPNIKKSAVSK